jgi:hypothetical protein
MIEVRGASRRAGLEERSHLEHLRQEDIGKFIKPRTSSELLLKRSDPQAKQSARSSAKRDLT